MKVGIVGIGALGTLWAAKLHNANHNVLAVTRDKSKTLLSIQLDELLPITIQANDLTGLKHCDAIFITVKSTQVKHAIAPLYSHISPCTPLIFLHNGMGAIDELDSKWQQFPILLATTTQAAFKPNMTQVKHTGIGHTLIGPHHSQLFKKTDNIDTLITTLNTALPDVAWQANITDSLWKKLAVNCVINPMTALYQCQNGQLLHPTYQMEVDALITECHQVMRAEGQQLTLLELSDFIKQIMHSTRKNYSSMYQDIHNNRSTEIDFITGFLLKKAKYYGINAPHHQSLYQQIKRLEAQFVSL